MYITIENNSIVVCFCMSQRCVGNELIKNNIFIHGISNFFDVAIVGKLLFPLNEIISWILLEASHLELLLSLI